MISRIAINSKNYQTCQDPFEDVLLIHPGDSGAIVKGRQCFQQALAHLNERDLKLLSRDNNVSSVLGWRAEEILHARNEK